MVGKHLGSKDLEDANSRDLEFWSIFQIRPFQTPVVVVLCGGGTRLRPVSLSLRGASSQSLRCSTAAAALWLRSLLGYSAWPPGSECHIGSLGTPGLKEPGSPSGTESFPQTQQEPAVMTPKKPGEPWLMETGLRFSWRRHVWEAAFPKTWGKVRARGAGTLGQSYCS